MIEEEIENIEFKIRNKMEKEQLEKGNELVSRIKDTKLRIEQLNKPRTVRMIQICTKDGCKTEYISTEFLQNNSVKSNGIHDDTFVTKVELLAKGYIESMIDLLKNQLNSLEKQLKEI